MKSYRKIKVTIVREKATEPYGAPPTVKGPQDIARMVRAVIGDDPREHFIAIYLDNKHKVIGVHVVSIGTANTAPISPREVFLPAVTGATRIGPCPTCKGTGEVPSAEEYAIHDHEGYPSGVIGEHTSLCEIAEIEAAIEGQPCDDYRAAFLALLAYSIDLERAKHVMEEGYRGEYRDLAEYAEEFCEECGYFDQCPESIRFYIDFEKMGRDWESSGDIFTVDSPRGCYIFDGTI